MRILTFLHSFEPGGVERIALRLVRSWRTEGAEASLFLGRTDGTMRDDIGAGLEFRSPPKVPRSAAKWETLWMIWQLPKVVLDIRPDVLFCAGNSYVIVAVAMKLILGPHCPPVIAKISNDLQWRHAHWWQRWPYRIWLRIQAPFLDHVVAMDSAMVPEIRCLLDIPGAMISVIPDPALSQELILRLRTNSRHKAMPVTGRRFVSIGRLAPQKNLPLMLRAFARGRRPGDSLTIIGEGQERHRLEKLAQRLGIGDNVEFRGHVAEPALMLFRFDALLLSSDYEGVPAVILEALAAGLPIIATDCSASMKSLLGNGQFGTLVDVCDETGMAQAITSVASMPHHERLSLLQVERFTIERSARAYLSTMAEVRARHSPNIPAIGAGSIARQRRDQTGE